MFVVRRRTPTKDDLKAYALAFRARCVNWLDLYGDPFFINAEDDEMDGDELFRELKDARAGSLVRLLREHGALPEELFFVCHPETGQSICAPIYTSIEEVSLEGRGSVVAKAFHGAEVHLLDAEGGIILACSHDYPPRIGLGETLYVDCNSDYQTMVKGRLPDEKAVEIIGYARQDRESDHGFETVKGAVYAIRNTLSVDPEVEFRGTGTRYSLEGTRAPGTYRVSRKQPEGILADFESWQVLHHFPVGLALKDMEDFTLQYNTFPFLDGRDGWVMDAESGTPGERQARHLEHWRREGYVDEVYRCAPMDFPFLPLQVRSDPDWVRKFCDRRPVCFLSASDSLRNDRDFIISMISERGSRPGSVYPYIPRHLRRDLDVLRAMHATGRVFELPDPETVSFLRYQDICGFVAENLGRVAELLKVFPNALRYAPASLLADKETVLMALDRDKGLAALLPPQLLDDEEVVLAACGEYEPSLGLASERLRRDAGFVMRMLEISGRNIEFAEERMRRDRAFVVAAAKAGSDILQHVPRAFTDDEEVMLRVIAHNGYSLRHASDRLRNDKALLLRALDAGLYHDAIEGELRNDRDIVLQAVRSQPHQFEGMPEAFRADREVALAAVSRKGYGYNIRHCPEALRDDEELALAAIRFDGPAALVQISQRLRDDRDFREKAARIQENQT
jgi:hypothetical protein